MKIDKVLISLSGLLQRWGLSSDDWILTGQYADVLQGYNVKVREGHLNILVLKSKIKWKTDPLALEFYPPKMATLLKWMQSGGLSRY